ncbi:MAG: DUF3108 domain-containing protein, partial [Ignavibacteria bacterium]|nr:DUF3108 domain-containing protein [Ignavibacteria bacterium]
MKTKIFLVILLIISAGFGYAQDTSKKEYRKIQQTAFGLGEHLEYEISYGFITAGNVVIEIAPQYQVINGRNCFDVTMTISSAPSFEWVYKMQDKYKCYIDAEGIFPWKFEQVIREGDYSKDFTAVFDHDNLKVKTTSVVKGEKKPDEEFNITKYVQDIVSAFYYARTLNIQSMTNGEVMTIQSFYKDNTYDMSVKILLREDADVPAGEFRTVMVQPLTKEGALIKKAENIALWVSDDDRKIPVKVQMMKISEIFYSIQGEGKRSGVPSVFIRTNFCNLRCKFTSGNLCDTAYTSWNPDDKYNRGIMSVDEIFEECRKYSVKEAVITGGEPAMQFEELTELCKRLREDGYYITIETNGTILGGFADFIDLMSV